MNIVVKHWALGFLMIAASAQADVSFTKPVNCIFRFYQYMDDANQETKENSKPLVWSFSDIETDKPMYTSPVETGEMLVYTHEIAGGRSLFIAQESGAHMFSIWPSGLAYWSTHKENGLIATEQFRGTCSN